MFCTSFIYYIKYVLYFIFITIFKIICFLGKSWAIFTLYIVLGKFSLFSLFGKLSLGNFHLGNLHLGNFRSANFCELLLVRKPDKTKNQKPNQKFQNQSQSEKTWLFIFGFQKTVWQPWKIVEILSWTWDERLFNRL